MSIKMYLLNMEGKIEKTRRHRESKVEGQMVELVNKLIASNEPTTIKRIAQDLGKRPQQIFQVLRKSTKLSKTKVKGATLVIPADASVPPVTPATPVAPTPIDSDDDGRDVGEGAGDDGEE